MTCVGGESWTPLQRGAMVHWLAHELRCPSQRGRPCCAAGFAIERADLLRGRRDAGRPRPGDLWVDLDEEGCGLVVSVRPDGGRGLKIGVRYLRLHPARSFDGDFYGDLGGRGRFVR